MSRKTPYSSKVQPWIGKYYDVTTFNSWLKSRKPRKFSVENLPEKKQNKNKCIYSLLLCRYHSLCHLWGDEVLALVESGEQNTVLNELYSRSRTACSLLPHCVWDSPSLEHDKTAMWSWWGVGVKNERTDYQQTNLILVTVQRNSLAK